MGKISDLENGGLEKNSYDFFNSPTVPNYFNYLLFRIENHTGKNDFNASSLYSSRF